MSYNEDQLKLISDAVKEQLGIEEDEDESLVFLEGPETLNTVYEEINVLKKSMKEKDDYIHKLELLLINESKRLDLLEQMFYEFKKSY